MDPALDAMIKGEVVRQLEHIELIASENYTSPAVMQAQGSQLTNKYAEGYPGKRFYGGCEYVDQVEQLAIDRLKALYGAEYALSLIHIWKAGELTLVKSFIYWNFALKIYRAKITALQAL